jgi:hypothetical protein
MVVFFKIFADQKIDDKARRFMTISDKIMGEM